MLKHFKMTFLTMLITTGCLQTENSSSADANVTGSLDFLLAREVIINNCVNCHIGHDYHLITEEQLIADGDIIPGDALNSPLYFRIFGSEGSRGPKDMPDGGVLSTNDLTVIRTWIDNIQP